MRTLLHGEALVDLISTGSATDLGSAAGFVPHVGGSAATIALNAAEAGADVALAGVLGDDAWGRWTAARLEAAGVAVDDLWLDADQMTPLAFTITGPDGAATTTLHGPPIAQLPADIAEGDALVLGADTLATDLEREATLALYDGAVKDGKPFLVDATFSPHRWETPAFAASATREIVNGAFLVVAGAEEGRLLTGEEHPARAAEGLVAMSAGYAIVVARAGAVLRGPGLRMAITGTPGPAAVLGRVLAELVATDFYPAAIPAALR